MEWIAKKWSQVLHNTNKIAHNLVTMSDLPLPSKKRRKTMPAPTAGISILLAECVQHRLGDFLENRDKGMMSMSCKDLYESKTSGLWKCLDCSERISNCKFSEMEEKCVECCNMCCGQDKCMISFTKCSICVNATCTDCCSYQRCQECSKDYCDDCYGDTIGGCEMQNCVSDFTCCVEMNPCGECQRINCAGCFAMGGYCHRCDKGFCYSCAGQLSDCICEDCREDSEDEEED